MEVNQPRCPQMVTAFCLLGILVILSYGNTFHAAWHFDDFPNIVQNPKIHLSDLSTSAILETFRASWNNGAYNSDRIYRPIPCLSFALNWYMGKDAVFGFHAVNMVLHLITAFFLYLSITAALRSPRLQGNHGVGIHPVALLAAAAWAAHPIQTQAVTYVVQRMTLLAGLFSVVALWCYLQFRLIPQGKERWIWLIGCAVAAGCALSSKENTIFMPLAFFLAEVIFFRDMGDSKERRRVVRFAVLSGIGLALLSLVVMVFMRGSFSAIMAGYEHRHFTMGQRLLTQPRVLLFYLSQIFYPLPERFCLLHDVPLSTSLTTPWTTMPAIGLVAALIFLGFWSMRRNPLLSFGILFFFCGHLIESTIVPLELIYEHRNYLPGMFLFMPICAAGWRLFVFYRERPAMRGMLIMGGGLCICILTGAAYVRNMDWATEKTLWEDNIKKYPGIVRPYINLAAGYYKKAGELDQARALYEQAMALTGQKNRVHQDKVLNGIADIDRQNANYDRAMEMCRKVLTSVYADRAEKRLARYTLTRCLIAQGRWPDALDSVLPLVEEEGGPVRENLVIYLSMKGVIHMWLGRFHAALEDFQTAGEISEPRWTELLYQGVCLSRLGEHLKANRFLAQALRKSGDEPLVYLALIENNALAGHRGYTRKYLSSITQRYTIERIAHLVQSPDNSLHLPLQHTMLQPIVQGALREIAAEMTETR